MNKLDTFSFIGIIAAALFINTPITFAASSVTYTGSGTFTVPDGVTSVWISMSGGGGGGGTSARFLGGGGGGGAAAVDSQQVSVTSGQVIPVTVGAGGGPGSGGGTSAFGAFITTPGGGAGIFGGASGAAGGVGGLPGQTGQTSLAGGAGGNSIFGTGGAGGIFGSPNGKNGVGYGAGGGGAVAANDYAGSGAPGFVKIDFVQPPRTSRQTFTSSGSFTVPNGITTLWVSMSGGGGGGGINWRFAGGGGGGGAAAVDSQQVSVTSGQVIPVTVGAGGGPGSGGGTSAFGAFITTPGGGGASMASGGVAGGIGGLRGQAGQTSLAGGAGGNSIFGTGGAGGVPGSAAGRNGSGYGSGGGGAGAANTNPGSGARGFIEIEYAETNGGTINVSTNVPVASWVIVGPSTITGSGTFASYASQPVGAYTIVWNAVPGYTTPSSQTLSILNNGDALTFTGTYTLIATTTVPTTTPTTTPTCNGTISTTNASACSATDPLVDTNYQIVANCGASPSKCLYTCDGGYYPNTSTSCVATQCNDGIDNDGDGRIDAAQDPGCMGSVSDNDETNVAPTLTASPRTVTEGSQTTLTWDTNNGNERACTLTGGNIAANPLEANGGDMEMGSVNIPVSARTTYTVTCPTGSASVTVDVIPVGFES